MNTIKCMIIRGGTSKGIFFQKKDLPQNENLRNKLLIRLMGSPDNRQIDGLGGATTLTSKIAMIKASTNPDYDLEYTFAQIFVEDTKISFPTCGNILTGAGIFGIESGLVPAQEGQTKIRILDINTQMIVEQNIETPHKKITSAGSFTISGVPFSGSPIFCSFHNLVGAKSGKLYPTGKKIDIIDGKECTCIDVAMPCVLFRACDFGVSGYENMQELNNQQELLKELLQLRLKAGEKMGFGDVSSMVYPKPILLNKPQKGGTIAARYFTPQKCHDSFAISGGFALLTACLDKKNISNEFVNIEPQKKNNLIIEHPCGQMELSIYKPDNNWHNLTGATTRTARILLKGEVLIPPEWLTT